MGWDGVKALQRRAATPAGLSLALRAGPSRKTTWGRDWLASLVRADGGTGAARETPRSGLLQHAGVPHRLAKLRHHRVGGFDEGEAERTDVEAEEAHGGLHRHGVRLAEERGDQREQAELQPA